MVNYNNSGSGPPSCDGNGGDVGATVLIVIIVT